MASENETVEDIVREMREEVENCRENHPDPTDVMFVTSSNMCLDNFALRIEAAWRREKDKIAHDALKTGVFVGATNVRSPRNCDRFASYKEAWKAFQKLHENDVPVVAEMLSWLFAPVAEVAK